MHVLVASLTQPANEAFQTRQALARPEPAEKETKRLAPHGRVGRVGGGCPRSPKVRGVREAVAKGRQDCAHCPYLSNKHIRNTLGTH